MLGHSSASHPASTTSPAHSNDLVGVSRVVACADQIVAIAGVHVGAEDHLIVETSCTFFQETLSISDRGKHDNRQF